MLQALRGAVLGVMLLPVSAVAGTPQQEADRCTRVLDALARGEIETLINVLRERYKPGDEPIRYLNHARGMARFIDLFKTVGGVKATAPVADAVVPETGDIIRIQEWTVGTGDKMFVGCSIYAGDRYPWLIALRLREDRDRLIQEIQRLVLGRLKQGEEPSP